MTDPLVESKQAESANAAAVATEALHNALATQNAQVFKDTLSDFFNAQTEKERFISTQRIPFICKDIADVRKILEQLLEMQREYQENLEKKLDEKYVSKDRFKPIEKAVMGFIAITLTTVIVSILYLVVKR